MSLLPEGTDQVTFDAVIARYKDNDGIAKAIAEKDRFIEQLKQEKAEALRDLQARPAVDRSQEILQRMEELAAKINTPATPNEDTTPQDRVETKGLTEDDIVRVMQMREQKARVEANLNQVKTDLVDRFGDKYGSVLKSLQEKLGVDQKFLDNLAAQSPAAFQGLLTQVSPDNQPVFTPPTSTHPGAFKPSAGGPQPRSAYLKLKAENKAMYDSPATQNKMYKDSMALGEAFFDVNE